MLDTIRCANGSLYCDAINDRQPAKSLRQNKDMKALRNAGSS
jgi:hypothetical protein